MKNKGKSLIFIISYVLFMTSVIHADYIKPLDKIASKFAKDIPKNSRVVVLNILRNDQNETYNSVDLAKKITSKLWEQGKGKFTVKDRHTADLLYYEESKYTTKTYSSQELAKILEGLQADIGIVGVYKIVQRTLYLENMQAVSIPSPEKPPNIISVYTKLEILLDKQDSVCFMQNEWYLPQPPDSITDYLLTATTNNDFVSAKITDLHHNIITDNCVKIGNSYRLSLDLKEPCFLYVFNYDEDANTVYLMHPYKSEHNHIMQNQVILPEGEYKYDAIEPPGNEFVKIFASKKPIPIIIPKSENCRMTHQEVEYFVNELKKLSANDWSSYRIFIHIVK